MSTQGIAAVFLGPQQPFGYFRLPLPALSAGEVLVRPSICTLCASDLHSVAGRRTVATPTILGHEAVGTVYSSGSDVFDCAGTRLDPGQRITWSIVASCGGCFYCKHHLPQKCEGLFKYGHEPITPPYLFNGALAEYCHLLPGTTIAVLPDSLSDTVAALANCAGATAAAVIRLGTVTEGDCVLVQGCGLLGLMVAAMASTAGARAVIVCDPNETRLKRASAFGATHTHLVTDNSDDLHSLVAHVTGTRGVDVALEMSGNRNATEVGIRFLRTGGRYVLAGAVHDLPPVHWKAQTIVTRMLSITGLHNYHPDDLISAVSFLAACHERFPFDRLIEGLYRLDQTTEAFAHAYDPDAVRVAVAPSRVHPDVPLHPASRFPAFHRPSYFEH